MNDPRIVVLVNNKVLAPEQAREELLRGVEERSRARARRLWEQA